MEEQTLAAAKSPYQTGYLEGISETNVDKHGIGRLFLFLWPEPLLIHLAFLREIDILPGAEGRYPIRILLL